MLIHDDQGEIICDIPLSEKQQKLLDASEEITVLFHTPRLLQGVVEQVNGAFTLHHDTAADHVVTTTPDALRKYAKLQNVIKAAQFLPKVIEGEQH